MRGIRAAQNKDVIHIGRMAMINVRIIPMVFAPVNETLGFVIFLLPAENTLEPCNNLLYKALAYTLM